MTLREIVDKVQTNFPDVTKAQLRAIMDAVFAEISSLQAGDRLIVRDLGTFRAVMTKERANGRNPRTGAAGISIASKRALKFRAAK